MKLNMNMVRIYILYCFRLLILFIEETIECYLDSLLSNDNQQEIIDQRTSQWIDDIRSVNIIFCLYLIELNVIFGKYSFLLMFE
jgi:hypothetical protein